VVDRVHAVYYSGTDVGIDDVAFDEFDAVQNLYEVAAEAGREVVDRTDAGSFVQEASRQMRTDEHGTAGDEDVSTLHSKGGEAWGLLAPVVE
jgi:hypothetical protein